MCIEPAIARAEAEINRCPPGGAAGIAALAAITGRRALPLDPACGVEQPLRVAVIDEALCIGCTLCIQACPVDAIVGAARRMHTVLPHLCTGCDLCVAPCPMDCIEMVPVAPPRAWTRADADAARDRYEKRRLRLAREIFDQWPQVRQPALADLRAAAKDKLALAVLESLVAVRLAGASRRDLAVLFWQANAMRSSRLPRRCLLKATSAWLFSPGYLPRVVARFGKVSRTALVPQR